MQVLKGGAGILFIKLPFGPGRSFFGRWNSLDMAVSLETTS